ncbi:MAG: alpha/beta fold hydrolase [Candidatus Methanoplasma sp.]|jgi:dipeptidyl aminopeptidase/acylaminoacyl peptidase|nr:alpha/beta fold hydrolase [Candidatus Methanoplasma sp.]
MAEEKIVVGSGTDYPLDGLLTLPDGSKEDLPAVVLVHGSGPQDLDERIGDNVPFRDIAEYLTDKGIAVLRYNKRTFVHGQKMVDEGNITVENETIEDAILAADILRNDPRIDKNRIFILGHSMGAMLAPRIDAEGGNFSGLILLAGTLRTLREIIKEQGRAAVDSLSGSAKVVAAQQVAAVASQLNNIDSLSDEEAKKTSLFGGADAYYFKEMEAHPADGYLEKIDKPILVLHGEADFQVSVEKDFAGYRKLLGNRTNVTFKTYPKLSHLFTEAIAGNSDYKIPGKVDTTVLNDISEWVLSK